MLTKQWSSRDELEPRILLLMVPNGARVATSALVRHAVSQIDTQNLGFVLNLGIPREAARDKAVAKFTCNVRDGGPDDCCTCRYNVWGPNRGQKRRLFQPD